MKAHMMVKADVDAGIAAMYPGGLAQFIGNDMRAYVQAAQAELRTTDIRIERYRITVEFVPFGEEPIFDPEFDLPKG